MSWSERQIKAIAEMLRIYLCDDTVRYVVIDRERKQIRVDRKPKKCADKNTAVDNGTIGDGGKLDKLDVN